MLVIGKTTLTQIRSLVRSFKPDTKPLTPAPAESYPPCGGMTPPVDGEPSA